MEGRNQAQDLDFIARSHEHVLNFPAKFRWEITRRHPYYLGLWQAAADYHRNFPNVAQPLDMTGFAAKLALGAIGVGGEPVSPTLSYDQIAGEDPTFLAGSVQPMTLRYLLSVLVTALGPDNQNFFADLLIANAMALQRPDFTAEVHRANAIAISGKIAMRPDPELDKVLATPLFYFHLGASQETIKEDANLQAKHWKAKRGLSSPKIHTSKLNQYLSTWDRFEGWTGGGYDPVREQTLKQIAADTRQRLSTVYDHVRAAFRAIIGHEYSSRVWWNTMGRLKLSQLEDGAEVAAARLARRRFARYPDRLVPVTTLTPVARSGVPDLVEGAVERDDTGFHDLIADILSLLEAGRTDAEIVELLGLTQPRSLKMLKYVRTKQFDLRELSH